VTEIVVPIALPWRPAGKTVLLSGKQINYAHAEKPKEICQAFVPLLQAFCEELQLCLTKTA
jgi:hypothetical protein